jgi:two-component system, cell cycle sensor histidine kinase and response regulator CckA
MTMNPITILIADDDHENRDFVAKILRRTGYHVLEAADGLEALELATRHPGPIDILVTDLRMPRMEGPELCRRMRAKSPATKFVIMSGYSDLTLDSELVFLSKPFSVPDLLRSVRRALEQSGASSPPEVRQ